MITISCSTHNRAYMEQIRKALLHGLDDLTSDYCYTREDCSGCPYKSACGDLNRAISFLENKLSPVCSNAD